MFKSGRPGGAGRREAPAGSSVEGLVIRPLSDCQDRHPNPAGAGAAANGQAGEFRKAIRQQARGGPGAGHATVPPLPDCHDLPRAHACAAAIKRANRALVWQQGGGQP